MPAVVVPKNALSFGAGYLYIADPGVSLPTYTVAGSVFTDVWPAGWNLFGITKEGHELSYEINTDTVEAAEYLDPLAYVTTGRAAGMKFELMQVHATNLKRAANGGLITVTGAGATTRNRFTLPVLGAEVRCQIGWESNDSTERVVAEQCFQVGSITVNRKKGADVATIPVEFRFETAASGQPFYYDTAGVARG